MAHKAIFCFQSVIMSNKKNYISIADDRYLSPFQFYFPSVILVWKFWNISRKVFSDFSYCSFHTYFYQYWI